MDHKHIDEFNLIDRYLMGRLVAEETTQFEEHFVDCEECVDRLKYTKGLMEGLHSAGIDGDQNAGARITTEAWFDRRKALLLVAGFISLIALAGVIVIISQWRHARGEAEQAKKASSEWERRYEEERQSSAATQSGDIQREHELTQEVDDLKAQLEVARKQEAAASGEINVPMFVLNSTRGGRATVGSANELRIPPSSSNFIVTLQLEGETDYRDYRLSIRDSRQQYVWKTGGIKPTRYNSVAVLLKSNRFRAGDYLLTLEGRAADGTTRVVGEYSFRILNAR